LDLEQDANVKMEGEEEEITLQDLFLNNKDERKNNMFTNIENMKVPGSYRILFNDKNTTVVDKFLENMMNGE
jgi:hypothetical protein